MLKVKKIQQKFDNTKIKDITGHIKKEFDNSGIKNKINPGQDIAVTVGSRGISNIKLIVREVITNLKKIGVNPFIIPAMGSHGGATARGQEDILASYGITEKEMKVPVKSSMDTVKIGEIEEVPIYFSKQALEADGIIALNRIKMHTDFHSNILESGMSKILVIGLGKHKGASSIHSRGVYGLKKLIPRAAELILEKAPVIQGIGLVENAYEKIMKIEFTPSDEIISKDGELLKLAENKMPTLPVNELDIAVVQEMGKDISGTGLDTNVIGRLYINGEKEYTSPQIKRLLVLDLTDSSHGNAIGIGLADITTRRLVDKIDYKDTYENVKTSSFLQRGKIPLTMKNEKEAFELAIKTSWLKENQKPKIIIMKNTQELEELYVSEPVLKEINQEKIEELGNWEQINFDENNRLIPTL